MRISQALGLAAGDSVAIVGAGGKSGLMSLLANELLAPVILSTTTHLGTWQSDMVRLHQVVDTPQDIINLNLKDIQKLLLTGPQISQDRLGGLNREMIQVLRRSIDQLGFILLVEADGAKQCNLKAPAEHEPVIPEWASHVVIVAGLGGLGQPLNENSVHRPQIFSQLTGLPQGDPIGVDDLVSLLRSHQGGLKNIPQGCQKILFLNQAEGFPTIAKGARIARAVLDSYDRVIIGSIKNPSPDGVVLSVITQTAGIILAAGGSQRLGRSKQLLTWDGKPFIRQVVLNALMAEVSPIYVVTGSAHEAVINAVEGLPVNLVYNPDWEAGQSSSMLVGLAAIPEGCDNVIFLLSDQPQVTPILIRQLIECYAQKRAPVTAPLVNGQRGNPVLFGKETFDALRKVRGDRGGRTIFNQFKVDWLPWIDERMLLDVDVMGDLPKLNSAFYE